MTMLLQRHNLFLTLCVSYVTRLCLTVLNSESLGKAWCMVNQHTSPVRIAACPHRPKALVQWLNRAVLCLLSKHL